MDRNRKFEDKLLPARIHVEICMYLKIEILFPVVGSNPHRTHFIVIVSIAIINSKISFKVAETGFNNLEGCLICRIKQAYDTVSLDGNVMVSNETAKIS